MIYFVWDSIQILFENQIKCSTMLPPSSQTPSQIITELASDQQLQPSYDKWWKQVVRLPIRIFLCIAIGHWREWKR